MVPLGTAPALDAEFDVWLSNWRVMTMEKIVSLNPVGDGTAAFWVVEVIKFS